MTHKLTTKTILFGAALIACGPAGAGGVRNLSTLPPTPVIVKVMVDANENALIITGHNFGTTRPMVQLAERSLETKRSSENEIVAHLPVGIQPATYSLTVTSNGFKRATSDIFNAAIIK